MKVIAILNEKGGSGKTTASLNIATALHRMKKSVVLVDADPQGSARDWRAANTDGADLPPVVAMDRPQMLNSLGTLNADYVIIDTPAKAEDMSAAAIRYAHLALVVIQPSAFDVWACAPTVKMLQSKVNVGGSIDVAFLTNRTSGGTKMSKEIEVGAWNTYGFNQLTATLGDREVFKQCIPDGLSVYDYAANKGQDDVNAVLAELMEARWL
jgi:chromosome partitioning protein